MSVGIFRHSFNSILKSYPLNPPKGLFVMLSNPLSRSPLSTCCWSLNHVTKRRCCATQTSHLMWRQDIHGSLHMDSLLPSLHRDSLLPILSMYSVYPLLCCAKESLHHSPWTGASHSKTLWIIILFP